MMDRVEQKSEKHVAQRRFPGDLAIDEEPRVLVPLRIVDRGEPLRQFVCILLVRGDRVGNAWRWRRYKRHFAAIDELARIMELVREEPHEIAGARRPRMRPVVRS